MLATRSRTFTDQNGWVWLEPERHSLTLRHGLVSLILSLMLVGAAAVATIPNRVVAVPSFALVVGVGAMIARGTWRESHTRLGVSPQGLLVQQGTSQDQIGWSTVVAVTGVHRRGRVRVRILTRADAVEPEATFTAAPARVWLEHCTDHAASRRLEPRPGPDDLGFVTWDPGV